MWLAGRQTRHWPNRYINAAGSTGSRIFPSATHRRHDNCYCKSLTCLAQTPQGYRICSEWIFIRYMACELPMYRVVLLPASRPARDDSNAWVLFLAASSWPWPCCTASRVPNLHRRGHLCSLSRRTRAAGQLLLGLDLISSTKAGLREWGRAGVYLRAYSRTAV